jgi:hypothetical protein
LFLIAVPQSIERPKGGEAAMAGISRLIYPLQASPDYIQRKQNNAMSELLDQLREKIRVKHYSTRTELAYVDWARLFILFHQKQHPLDMGEPEASQFLSHLATQRQAAASTENQTLSALVFPMDFLAAEAPRRGEKVKGE